MRYFSFIGSMLVCLALAGSASTAFAQRAGRGTGPTNLVDGSTVYIHESTSRAYWAPLAAKGDNGVYFISLRATDDTAVLDSLRRVGEFTLRKDDVSHPSIISGDTIRIWVNGDALVADPDYDPHYVQIDSRYRWSNSSPDARFVIEKYAGSPGLQLRTGDEFTLRGVNGRRGLYVPCQTDTKRVCITDNPMGATVWVAETFPPSTWTGYGAPPPGGWPPKPAPNAGSGGSSQPSTPTSSASAEPATGCVVQTHIGPIDVWKYRNNCSRRVRATVRRTCYRLSGNDSRDAEFVVGPNEDYDFHRPLMFGSYCEPPYSTLEEGIVKQVYEN